MRRNTLDPRKQKQILFVLFIGVLMGALDIAIVGPALPAIRSDFGLTERALSWIFSLYILFNLVGTPLMAKLSDQFGRRTIYALDVSLFATGSLLVALAPNFTMVLIGRAVQGIGAGGIFPVASAVIGDTFPAEKRGSALGMIGAVFGLAFLIGPILGGVILGFASWHWLFLLNLPLALLVVVLSLRVLPVGGAASDRSFDWAGMAVLALALASLSWATNQIDTQNFLGSLLSAPVLPFLLAFAALIALLVFLEKRASNPVVPPALFDRSQLRLTYVLSAGAGFAEASTVFLSLLAVATLGAYGINEHNASWMLMPVVLAMAVGSPVAGRMLDKLGSRRVILTGTAIMAAGMLLMGLTSGSMALFILAGVLVGLGMSSLLGAPLRYIMLSEARAAERTIAQGVVTIFTSAGQLLGGALTGAVAASRAATAGTAAGYSLAFLVIGLVGLLLVGAALFLKNREQEQAALREHDARPARPGAAETN